MDRLTSSQPSPLAAFVKQARKQLNLSQEDLALRSGVGLRFIRDLEQGRERNFKIDNINQILLIFGYELQPRPMTESWPQDLSHSEASDE